LSESKKEWKEWINLKGILLIDPVVDKATQREQTPTFAEKRGLIGEVGGFFMSILEKWCRSSISSNSVFQEIIACGVSDSIVTGNPIFPIFDYRNIKKECPYWFTCYENNFDQQVLMN